MMFPQTALIIGLGKTGLSCARFLAARGDDVIVTDTREQPPAAAALREALPEAKLYLGGYDAEALARADFVVVSPGVSAQHPYILRARALGLAVCGDIELFAREAKAPIVAITGTNGKSTVTTCVGKMAERDGRRVCIGGNLGTPALDLLSEPVPEFYVLEVSSFQLDLTDYLPLQAAVVLNVTPDHLDRYQNFDDYVASKGRIYYQAQISVVNRDDPRVVVMAERKRKIISFGLQAPRRDAYGLVEIDGEDWFVRGDTPLMAAREFKLMGAHNKANALAALALGESMGLTAESMVATLRDFCGLDHRMSFVTEQGGVRWFDDSKATNVGAAIAATVGVDAPLVVIAGGDGKGQDFTEFAQALVETAKMVVLIGRDGDKIAAALEDIVPYTYADDMNHAVAKARATAQAGDVVVLAPACASLDMFANYEARGRAYIDAIHAGAS